MITVKAKYQNKEWRAHYIDESGFFIKFGPYPNRKAMETSLKEYMDGIKKDYKIKKE